MSALAPYASGFLEELEKLAEVERDLEAYTLGDDLRKEAKKPVKETRKGWLSPKSRKGTRPLKVSTLLKKEKEGTLGGYKLAHVLDAMGKFGEATVPFIAKDNDAGAAPRPKKPGDVPSRDDVGGTIAKREDGRGNAATLHGPGTVLHEISASPGERSE